MNESRPGSRMARALRARVGQAGGIAAPAGSDGPPANVRDSTSDGSQDNPVRCERCNREFQTMRGLGVH